MQAVNRPRPGSRGRRLAAGVLVAFGILAALAIVANLPQLLVALLVIGVVLVVVGCFALPFLLVGLAVYGLSRLMANGRPAGHVRRPFTPPPPGPASPHGIVASPETRPPDLPPDLAAQVARIQEKATALQSPEQQPYLHVEDRRRVEETVEEYLPRILATHRAFPRGSEGWTVESEGTTVRDLIARQLTVLEESLDEIARRVFQAGADHLIAQQRFLEERFQREGPGELQL
ncbi:MAG: hypothetical protein LBJ87_11270 [bacterium]|jgi:hypothetical protein|nr:hypothetical protein [bacterium]